MKRPEITDLQNRVLDILEDESWGILPAPMDAQLGLEALAEYLLGEKWAVSVSLSREQVNTCMVAQILERYCPKFRKHRRWRRKQHRWFFQKEKKVKW